MSRRKVERLKPIKSKIQENTGNNRCIWRTIKHLLGKSKTRSIRNEDLSPNIFNEHFATIGNKLSTKFNDGRTSLQVYHASSNLLMLMLSLLLNHFHYAEHNLILMYMGLIRTFFTWNQLV